jgi:hypothetical protein
LDQNAREWTIMAPSGRCILAVRLSRFYNNVAFLHFTTVVLAASFGENQHKDMKLLRPFDLVLLATTVQVTLPIGSDRNSIPRHTSSPIGALNFDQVQL